MLAHWDEIEPRDADRGHLGAFWRDLGRAAGSKTIGAKRIDVKPGKWSTPVHRQTAEEEIFYVLRGSGICLQDDAAYEVGPGDCLLFLADGPTHSLKGGDDGLDVIAFGTRVPTEIGHLPRAGVAWIGGSWAEVEGGKHPWQREVEAGEPEVPEPGDRPDNAVNLDHVEGEYEGTWKRLGKAAGSQRTGLNWGRLAAGESEDNAHCHSAEEELFVVLDGEGTIFLGGEPHPVRAGSVIARPAGTGVPHTWRAGGTDLVVLFYGTREPNDITYYPGENALWFKGVNKTIKLEGEAKGL